ncbi:S-adenosyl-L-methionine-dependent methyltransferase [Rhizodiscina lignyota]|uniref:S-adenosyl-L-methionine-dependent methyltransferase n=1 Tax=Rhizodiscina lignyota TaxID=1504668 RepID=A0A9P4M142_9PEZI|nr:S-adenosyl-L-methionine-dependent methyltransferase [Rhizodiscina lignyota]
MSRPEDTLPPDLYYNDPVSRQYTTSSRIQKIQAQMTHRALQILNLPPSQSSHILDVGSGSGLSGAILTQRGHTWVGMDISASMLAIALQRGTGALPRKRRKLAQDMEMDVEDGIDDKQSNDEDAGDEEVEDEGEEDEIGDDAPCEGDLLLADIGQALPFRPGTFDAAISISAVQWLCQAESSDENDAPTRRLKRFFEALYVCLKRGGKAVMQFYPRNQKERDMVGTAARRAGFGAGFLVDAEGTKAEKVYLVCSVGGEDVTATIEAMEDVEIEGGAVGAGRGREQKGKFGKGEYKKGSKEWIMRKKERMERKGMVVKKNSKYTGRKRKVAF